MGKRTPNGTEEAGQKIGNENFCKNLKGRPPGLPLF